jgi:hypothetical protein
MSDDELTVRLSQTVTPFGVGAIYDILGQSFVACDTYRWFQNGRPLRLDRLARALGVGGFREPPTVPDLIGARRVPGLPYHRFPQWVFCPSCRRMEKLKASRSREEPKCSFCRKHPRLVPMRFVMACPDGHLADIDWWWWAHTGTKSAVRCENRNEQLRFEVDAKKGGGLASLSVRAACGQGHSFEQLTQKDGLVKVGMKCPNGQPWQRLATDCPAPPRAMQRGASNLYFPRLRSALDIPPESNYRRVISQADAITNSPYFATLMEKLDDAGNPTFIGKRFVEILADEFDVEPKVVENLAKARFFEVRDVAAADADADEDIDLSEYQAFLVPRLDQDERDCFITEHSAINDSSRSLGDDVASAMSEIVDRVVLGRRLREIRALTGFTRIREGGKDEHGTEYKVVTPSLGRATTWLPAIEVFGEGLFLSFDEDYVERWESRPAVRARAERTAERLATLDWTWLPEPTPRFLALHTLAHLLIRRLTFECGYASASLREKIYARPVGPDGDPMAGLLVYTAAGDSEGSLGGLVRQGEPPRLARTLLAAVEEAAWCSADPICSESHTGPGAVNSGACHACSLVAETSCTCANLLLDRNLLIGTADFPGFLAPLLNLTAGTTVGES